MRLPKGREFTAFPLRATSPQPRRVVLLALTAVNCGDVLVRTARAAHRDRADRILVATARVLGTTLLTQDRRIVDAALADTLR